MDEIIDPQRAQFERDLEGAAMADGILYNKWTVVSGEWPDYVFAVTAGDGQPFAIRVNFDGYPSVAPAGTPWDLVNDRAATLEQLPTGSSAEIAFRSEWSKQNSLTPYMATERVLMTGGHPDWATSFPARAWNSARTVAFYLEQLHRELGTCRMPGLAAA